MALPNLEDYFPDWKEREALAEKMIPLIGNLYRKNVVTYCYGRALYNQNVMQIMKSHRFVRQVAQNELSEFETFTVLTELSKLDLGPCHIDLGKLTTSFMEKSSGKQDVGVSDFVRGACGLVIGRHIPPISKPQDVVLYGFGRIGRLLARLLIEKTGSGQQLRLRAIVVRSASKDDLVKRASLLRRDSVHGSFQGTIRVDEANQCIIANGNVIRVIYSETPSDIDFTSYGIQDAIIIDNTGRWRSKKDLRRHFEAKGVAKVVLTAPAKGDDVPDIVSGVNSDLLKSTRHDIIAAASCTTNAIVPVLKAVDDKFGIEYCHIETVHAYTNDQNLIDNYHRKSRRGRSAALNMVITETGASDAVVKLLPHLRGKLTGSAIRVPTPNVSLAILNLEFRESTTLEEVIDYLRYTSLHSPLQRQIDLATSPEVVSSDFVGNRHACAIDAKATSVNGKRVVLYVWYDNEFGYSCQVIRVIQKWAGISYPLIPKEVSEIGF